MKEDQNSLLDQAEQLVETNYELYTLRLTAKIATVVSSLFSRLIFVLLGILVLFLWTMGLAIWIGDMFGRNYMGFFLIGAVCALVMFIGYRYRRSLINKPVMDTMISQMLK